MPGHKALLEELEPRILYSADLAAALGAAWGVQAGAQAVDWGTAQAAQLPHELRLVSAAQQAGSAHEIAFVDLGVPDAQTLVAGLAAQRDGGRALEIVTIAAGEDGLAVISHTLQGRHDINAVHLYSHGSPGQLQLGSSMLSQDTVLQRAHELAAWGSALTADADLLLYGCDVAASDAGQALVRDLAALTGADVAASDNTTGAAASGGDWVLERRSGPIEAVAALGLSAQQAWQGTLVLLAQEPFVGIGSLQGSAGGSGWANAWSGSGTGIQRPGGTSLVSPAGQLDSSGGAAQLQVSGLLSAATATRDLVAPLGADGSTAWFSFLLEPQRVSVGDFLGLQFGSSSAKVAFAGYNAGQFIVGEVGALNRPAVPGISAGAGVDTLLVVRVQHQAGNDMLTLYVNPTPGAASPDGGLSTSTALDLGSYTRVGISGGNGLGTNSARLDEVRIGTTYADVTPYQRPAITSNGGGASASLGVPENTTAVTTVTATAANGVATAFSIAGGADAAAFSIHAGSGVLSFGTARNFEAPTDAGGNNIYNVVVMASDGTQQDTQALTINVTDVNEAPVVALPLVDQNATQGTAFSYTFAAGSYTDPDGDSLLLLATTAPNTALPAWLSLNAATHTLSGTPGQADVGSVVLRITAVDPDNLAASDEFMLTVANVNDAPVITSNGGGSTVAVTVDENTTVVTTVTVTDADGTTPVFSIAGGADAARFAINPATGALSFVDAPDFETPVDSNADNLYQVTVRASDGSLSDDQALTVSVVDDPVADVLLATQDTWIDASNPGLNHGQATQLVLNRADGGIGNGRVLLQFDVAPIPSGAVVSSATLLMNASQNGGALNLNVYRLTSAWVEGSASGTAGAASWNERLTGSNWTTAGGDYSNGIQATLNSGATGIHQWNVTTLVQGWAQGTFANQGLVLGSADLGVSTVTYDSAEGAYAPRLMVTYTGGNVAPTIVSNGAGASASLNVAENSTAVTTVVTTDADLPAQAINYSISGGADAARFNVNPSTGALAFISAPDFEAPADSNADNVYTVWVRASDGGLADEQTFTVTVTNVANLLTVTTTADVLDGNTSSAEALVMNPGADGLISLREAISAANNDTTGPATIALGSGSYGIGIAPVGASNDNADGDFDITATLTINGTGAATSVIDGQSLDRLLDLRGSANVTLNNLTLRGGLVASNQYGAAAKLASGTGLTLTGVVMTANQAGSGGAIYNYQGVVTANDSTISNSAATNWGGGIYNDRGMVTLVRSTLSGNTSGNDGGAINSAGSGARLILVNSTLSGNSASGLGGGVYSNRDLTALNSTIAYNVSGSGAAGVHLQGAANAQLQNTLLFNPAGANANNTINSLGHNFDSDGSAGLLGTDDIRGTAVAKLDPLLGPLLNNGGPTATHALLAGSAALDAASSTAAPATDQRGIVRTGTADIGAYEAPSFVNRAPHNTVASGFAVLEDTVTALPGLSVSDSDESSGVAQSRLGTSALSVQQGRLLVTLTGGAIITAGANSSTTLTLSGSEAALNATLATLSYQSAPNHAGVDTLLMISRDGGGLVDSDSTTVSVAAVNDAPAGNSATLSVGATLQRALVRADFGYSDMAAESNAFRSVLVQMPSAGTLRLAGTALSAATEVTVAQLDANALVFEATTGASGPACATLQFQVRDNGGTASGGADLDPTPATFTFDIANRAPAITAPGAAATLALTQPEGRAAVTTVGAVDADTGTLLLYSITGGADAALFSVDAGSGVLRFITAPDHESPQDANADNVYELTVQVSDGQLTDSQAISVTVTPVNEGAPVITSDGGAATAFVQIPENTRAVTRVTASDADRPATALSYGIAGGADAAAFSIHAGSGVLSFVTAPDFETPTDSGANNVYDVIVSASDGLLSATQAIRVSVANLGGPLVVSTTADVLDGHVASIEALLANPGADGLISLREAISAANQTAGADTILLGAGSHGIGIAPDGSGDDNLDGDFDVYGSLTIAGAGAAVTSVDGQALDRVFHVRPGASLAVIGITIRGALLAANAYGGGLYAEAGANLALSGVSVTANQAGSGAGIYNLGTLTAADTTLSNNVAANWGAGIFNDRGSVTLDRVTVSGNTAGRDGGGIYNSGSGAALSLSNVTLSANAASNTGGGLYSNRTVTINSSTIAFNSAASGTAGVHIHGAGSAMLGNTLLFNPGGSNAAGVLASAGHNLDSDGTAGLAGSGDLVGSPGTPIDPRLGALQNNTGATATHALLAGSAAIDAGNTASAAATDQRGNARVGSADIGAYEAATTANRAPVNTVPGAQIALEDTATLISGLAVTDPDDGAGPIQRELNDITLSVAHGTLFVTLAGSTAVSAGASGSNSLTLSSNSAGINATLSSLRYQGHADRVGSDTLTIISRDGVGLSDTDTVALSVMAVNDPPAGADRTLTLAAGASLRLTRADFGYSDAAGESNRFSSVLLQLPSQGTLRLAGLALSAATEVTVVQLDAGQLTYLPAAGAGSGPHATLAFQVRDDGGTASGGVDLDPTPATLNLAIVNNAPVFTSRGPSPALTLTQPEGRTPVTTLHATDADASAILTYSIVGGADGALFGIHASSGELRFTTAPDFENPLDANADNVYQVVVRVSDGSQRDTAVLRIAITDVEHRLDVTTTADMVDGDTSSIDALWAQPGSDGLVSLREALIAANRTPGLDNIGFDIGTPLQRGAHPMQLASELPDLVSPVFIDGRSQREFAGTPVIELDGQGLLSHGLRLAAGSDGSTVQGLVISRYTGDAFQIVGSNLHTLVGNFVGTDVTGHVARGNGGAGVWASGRGITIGGTTALDANVIAGSGRAGIWLDSGAADVVITGNRLGAGRGGEALGNQWGIALGSGVHGVRIGGTAAGAGNLIAHSAGDGIRVASLGGSGNHWLGNRIFDNGGLGIELGSDGVTPNDAGDVDNGANHLQNHPVLGSAASTGADTVISGALHSNPGINYRIEFFSAASADASGHGPGAVWLGAISVGTDASGRAGFDTTLSGVAVSVGHVISAVAVVDLGGGVHGDASEFGPAVTVAPLNSAPVITSNGGGGRAAVWVPENSIAVTRMAASDGNLPAQTLTYSIAGGADAARFAIEAGSGDLTFRAAADFETPTDSDRDHVYEVQVQVSDGALVDSQLLSVTVADVNEFAVSSPVDTEASDNTVAEDAPSGTLIGLKAQATDLDGSNHTVSYTLDNSAGGRFSIDAATGQVRVAGSLDAETTGGHVVTVRAWSSDGSSSRASFIIGVQDVDEHDIGALNDADAAPNSVDETAVIGTPVGLSAQAADADASMNRISYSLDDDAGGRFAVDAGSGLVTVARALGEEGAATHGVVVRARSADGSSSAQSFDVVVVPQNDHDPSITSNGAADAARLEIDEGQTLVTVIGAVDTDLPAPTLRYSLVGGADAALFRIDAASGVLRLASAPDFEAPADADGNGRYEVEVAANDGQREDRQAITVRVRNVNEAPLAGAVDLGTGAEDSALSIDAAALLAATTDPEGDTLSLTALRVVAGAATLRDLGGGRWQLDPAPDWSGSVQLTFDVSDGILTTPCSATVRLAPVNDAPVFTSLGGAPAATLQVVENSSAVARLSASDVDDAASALRFAIAGGADAALFTIDVASGALGFVAAPDREVPRDADGNGVYEVIVAVSDGQASATQVLRVGVTDIDEAPVIGRQALLLSQQGVTLVLLASDPEGAAATLVYEVLSTQGGHFEMQLAPGRVLNGFTQADVDASRVLFVADGSASRGDRSPGFQLALSDGVNRVEGRAPEIVGTLPLPAAALPAVAEPAPAPAVVPAAALTTAAAANATAAAADAPTPAATAPIATPQPLVLAPALAATPTAALAPAEPGERWRSYATAAAESVTRPDTPGADTAFWAAGLGELAPAAAMDIVVREPVTLDLLGSRASSALAQAMDAARPRDDQDRAMTELGVASTALVSSGLSVGYVLWLARGGVLAASLMSSVPAWASVDPLPVLKNMRRNADNLADEGPEGDEVDPIDRLFSRARKLLAGTAPASAAPAAPAAPAAAAASAPGQASAGATSVAGAPQRETEPWA